MTHQGLTLSQNIIIERILPFLHSEIDHEKLYSLITFTQCLGTIANVEVNCFRDNIICLLIHFSPQKLQGSTMREQREPTAGNAYLIVF